MPMPVDPVPRDACVYVAGHRGLVGSAVWRHLKGNGFGRLVGASSAQLDLRDRDAVRQFVGSSRPQVVVLAAARVGGIWANARQPADFLSDNLRIQTNVLDAAHEFGVDRLLFLGSSCIYPRLAPQPIPESALLTGPLEPTNEAYAIAKIAGLLHVRAMRHQHGHRWISAMPTNLYGPGDTFDPESSHVLPAMIRRFHDAVATGAARVTIWGTGTPRREFLHVDDLASACLHLLDHYDGDVAVNVGTGADVSIRELAELTAQIAGWRGTLEFDPSRPDGTPRKLLDVGLLDRLGWKASIPLPDGLAATYAWYRDHGAHSAATTERVHPR
jgi:GDP-L-fucose synthase